MLKLTFSILSGVSVFLAFEKFHFVPAVLFFPYLFNRLSEFEMKPTSAFLWGFLTSFVVMLGGFYWIVYVIHEFGYLPWSVSALLYLGFCGFGALNFPVFLSLVAYLRRRFSIEAVSPTTHGLWTTFALPALFTLVEFLIPKLFPWSLGHCLYRQTWLIQIVELTGCTFLTFALYSLGSTVGSAFIDKKTPKTFLAFPLTLLVLMVCFSLIRMTTVKNEGRTLRVALVQANIGSLEKVSAESGIQEKVRYVVEQHERLTEQALKASTKPDLILWPETALPFQVDGLSKYAARVKADVVKWQVPLIAGAYSQSVSKGWKDYNAAFFIDPSPNGSFKMEKYFKIILLAFGEYLPFGEYYPKLYRMFPQIAGFERGKSQDPFTMKDGTRLGINICYEAILPQFYRRSVNKGVHAVINLTNDSWFGPTSEPYLHGSLTVFRAIETRIPLFRVTNTGTSFSVDSLGNMSELTPVYEEALLRSDLVLPKEPPRTLYLAYGDWFAWMLVLTLIGFGFYYRKTER